MIRKYKIQLSNAARQNFFKMSIVKTHQLEVNSADNLVKYFNKIA